MNHIVEICYIVKIKCFLGKISIDPLDATRKRLLSGKE